MALTLLCCSLLSCYINHSALISHLLFFKLYKVCKSGFSISKFEPNRKKFLYFICDDLIPFRVTYVTFSEIFGLVEVRR